MCLGAWACWFDIHAVFIETTINKCAQIIFRPHNIKLNVHNTKTELQKRYHKKVRACELFTQHKRMHEVCSAIRLVGGNYNWIISNHIHVFMFRICFFYEIVDFHEAKKTVLNGKRRINFFWKWQWFVMRHWNPVNLCRWNIQLQLPF